MKKTLGGDRLGSGNKMQVELHNFERSTHDLGYLWRSTMSAGTLIPFLKQVALPGDTFDINLDCDIKTHPTIGPLFGSYKVQLDVFQAPMRLYNSLLHNNALDVGLHMDRVIFPRIYLTAQSVDLTTVKDIDNSQINPSSLLAYLGIRGIGLPGAADRQRSFNAMPILAYWEIYKQYYANKQEEIGAVIHTPIDPIIETVTALEGYNNLTQETSVIPFNTAGSNLLLLDANTSIYVAYTGTPPNPKQIYLIDIDDNAISLADLVGPNGLYDNGTALLGLLTNADNLSIKYYRYQRVSDLANTQPKVETFPLSNIDEMRKQILKYYSETTPFDIDTDPDLTPYIWLVQGTTSGTELYPNVLNSQEGLAIKTYQSDMFNNWLQTEWIDGTNGINAITAIDTSGGEFTLDTLNLAKKVYDMLNRIAVSGGTYYDWIDAAYGHEQYFKAQTPIYCGGLIKELVFQEVISNAQSGDQKLGTLAGRGILGKKHKGGKIYIKVDEPSYIIGLISLTPRVDYSQGNDWDIHLRNFSELHNPGMDGIGFQDLITEQMAWWDTEWDTVEFQWKQKSAGKQPAWMNYMTSVNKTYGNFAVTDNEMFMTLNRRYEYNADADNIKDLTTYIDPVKFNHIFASTAIDAQNFWAQIAVDITARRKMSAKVMPNL